MTIIRGTNRDKGGINRDFLCIKGRYAFDFVDHAERLTSPLMRIDVSLETGLLGKSIVGSGEQIQRRPPGPRHDWSSRLESRHK